MVMVVFFLPILVCCYLRRSNWRCCPYLYLPSNFINEVLILVDVCEIVYHAIVLSFKSLSNPAPFHLVFEVLAGQGSIATDRNSSLCLSLSQFINNVPR